jgi:hypothetical protein
MGPQEKERVREKKRKGERREREWMERNRRKPQNSEPLLVRLKQ